MTPPRSSGNCDLMLRQHTVPGHGLHKFMQYTLAIILERSSPSEGCLTLLGRVCVGHRNGNGSYHVV